MKTKERGLKQGRPMHWNNCLDLDAECEMYYEWCEEKGKHPGVIGLACFLNVNKATLYDYEGRDQFSDTIKKHKQRIEAYLEECLHNNAVTGTIFNLKNNFGWKDKTEVQQDKSITVVRKTYGGDNG